jgi:hypothetical protein
MHRQPALDGGVDLFQERTIDLFAAMNVGTGQVHDHLRKGHTAADVLARAACSRVSWFRPAPGFIGSDGWVRSKA